MSIQVGDTKVDKLDKNKTYFFNKNTIIYGASGTGKSTIIKEILKILVKDVSKIFVFSPTADENNDYKGIIPNCCIFREVDIKQLEKIYNHQKGSTLIYNNVNNIDSLKRLALMVASYDEKLFIQNIFQTASKKIELIESSSISNKLIEINSIKNIKHDYLKKHYKQIIRRNKTRLLNMVRDKDKNIIKYIDYNPNCIIIMDDCGAELKKFQKTEVIRQIFFQGRHKHLNLILSLQDDLKLASSIKKNAFVSIFTTRQVASAYFNRSSTNYSKRERHKADAIIDQVFAHTDYKKLVYLRGTKQPFRYIQAEQYEPFRFGCSSLWKIDDLINKKTKKDNWSNPILNSFGIDI